MSVRADVETFRSIPIFSECDAVHLQLLAFSAARQNFSAGEFIIRQGNKNRHVRIFAYSTKQNSPAP